MRVYLDTSALVKCYMTERNSPEVLDLAGRAEIVASSLLSRTEVAAALAKAVRLGVLRPQSRQDAHRDFLRDWADVSRIPVTEALVTRADTLAWDYALRAYDAVQLASALTWQESLGRPVTLATFDHELWEAGRKAGMHVWPAKLTG